MLHARISGGGRKDDSVGAKPYTSEDKGKIGGMYLIKYSPPQQFGHMLMISIRNRIQICKGKRVCAYLVYCSLSARAHGCLSEGICANCMSAWVSDLRARSPLCHDLTCNIT